MRLSDYLRAEHGRTKRIAEAVGIAPAFLSQIATGHRPAPPEHCAAIERETQGAIRRWHLRAADWHRIWPELIATPGAPDINPAAEAAITQETAHAV